MDSQPTERPTGRLTVREAAANHRRACRARCLERWEPALQLIEEIFVVLETPDAEAPEDLIRLYRTNDLMCWLRKGAGTWLNQARPQIIRRIVSKAQERGDRQGASAWRDVLRRETKPLAELELLTGALVEDRSVEPAAQPAELLAGTPGDVSQVMLAEEAERVERALAEHGGRLEPGELAAFRLLTPLVRNGWNVRRAAKEAAGRDDVAYSPETLRRYFRDALSKLAAVA